MVGDSLGYRDHAEVACGVLGYGGCGVVGVVKHLWEVKHSYYCNEGNYFTSSRDLGPHYKRWSDFLEEWSDSDMDYNLFFRWDWSEETGDGEPTFKGDVNYRNGTLKMFIMGQRKGLYNWVTVEVCRADEPAVIEFLKPRAEYLKSLWSPLL